LCDRIDNLCDSGLSEDFLRSTYIDESRKLYDIIVKYDYFSPASWVLVDKIHMHENKIKSKH